VYHCVRHVSVLALVISAVLVVAATPASGKVLPYQLEVSPTTTVVGRPVTITMLLDPSNTLGDRFDFEIGIFRVESLQANGWPRATMKPLRRVVMTRTSDRHTYSGVFTARHRGRYVVVGTSGRPIWGSDPRCLPAEYPVQRPCWPAPVTVDISARRKQRAVGRSRLP
jgi:hypothetical protein